MRFLRRRSDFAVLALVALAAQMLLSFGHSHARHVIEPSTAMACRTFLPPATDPPCSPHRHDDSKDCQICWSVSVAGAAVIGAPPVLVLPLGSGAVVATIRVTMPVPSRPAAAFQPRGPPVLMFA